MTAIKICGLTNAENARLCVEAGVEMLGLNFSPLSPRCLSLTAARAIVSAVHGKVKLIGVFVNQARDLIEEIADALELDALQLHGEESISYQRALAPRRVIKTLRIQGLPAVLPESESILLDRWNEKMPGGTGETFDWSIAAALRPRIKNLILAGGLTPENVGAAIRAVRPDAVDVCSGVEISPGKKDGEKIARFVAAVRA